MSDARGFYWLSQSWYAESNLRGRDYTDEIMIGIYGEEGGTSGEFAIRWFELGGKSVPRVEVFDDAWAVFAQFSDLIALLSRLNGANVTPLQLAGELLRLGFVDRTARTSPATEPPRKCAACGAVK